MSKETSLTEKQSEKTPITPVCVTPVRTLRRNSIKPRRSILKVKSLRPTKAVMGKIK